jgi:hypothetical protein
MAPRFLVALSALALLASFAAAQEKDDWKWDPSKKHKFEKGYRHVVDYEKHVTRRKTASRAGEILEEQTVDVKTTSRHVREVLEATDGNVTKARVKVETWKVGPPEGKQDTCLEGKTILVIGTGTEASWRCEDADAELTEEAKKWIESRLVQRTRREDDDATRTFLPASPLAPVSSWTRAPAPVARAVLQVELFEEKSSVKGTLSTVRIEHGVHVGRFEVNMEFAIRPDDSFPTGAFAKWTLAQDGSLEPDKRDAQVITSELLMTMKREHEDPDGTITVKMVMKTTSKQTDRPAENDAGGRR